jgi:hypothetical protein
MTLDGLQHWILSDEGMGIELALLARFSAAKALELEDTQLDPQIAAYTPNWRRLLFAGSILSHSSAAATSEAALSIAHAGLLFSGETSVSDASAILLEQLANHRAVKLAEVRHLLREGLDKRLGVAERIFSTRRYLDHTLSLKSGDDIQANNFQRAFWTQLEETEWISASAPTASGKTYLVLQWLLNQFAQNNARLAVFLAPTRALVSEVERELLDLASGHGIEELRVASLPLAELGDRRRPTILVFTQERLHVFLNALEAVPQIDIAIIDEVQKLSDGLRGVILQDAIERVARSGEGTRFVFLSPLTENPEILLQDAPPGTASAAVPSETPTVTQNLLIAEQQPRQPRRWKILLQKATEATELGTFELHARPDGQRKRLSYTALALGRHQGGTLIYANGAHEAEQLAWQIYEGLSDEYLNVNETDPELNELSSFARDTVHPQFQLVELLKRGVAFHYGNMPSLLRSEIERLFKNGVIRFLVCTSTLIEGVNLACRTIVVRGPRKGNNQPMGAHDFWNLAGRAGRWGSDFHGNIVCVDVHRRDLWPQGPPRRTRYSIRRETDAVLGHHEKMLAYLERRQALDTSAIEPQLEQVAAYLLAWQAREGSFRSTPSATRLPAEYAEQLDTLLSGILANIDVPVEVISRHPGVSAVALQSLLSYFRGRRKPAEELVPAPPESDDAQGELIAVFKRIQKHLYPAFVPEAAIPVHALVTVQWMRGLPLGQIIRNRMTYFDRRGSSYTIAAVIRETMRDVEEVARFRAPKYLAAYLDVLKLHLNEIGRSDLFPVDLKFDLYLEFGVATTTLLSLIGLGLSRTSAVSLNEFLGSDVLGEDQVWRWLLTRRWESLSIPIVVKKEIDRLMARRLASNAAA